MANTVKMSHGATVRVGRGETPTWTTIDKAQSVELPDRAPADLDVTHQASPGFTEESIPGLTPAVDWALELLYVPASATDVALVALSTRDEDGSLEEHLLEITQGGVTRAFNAYLKSYTPKSPLKGALAATATWRVMGEVVE